MKLIVFYSFVISLCTTALYADQGPAEQSAVSVLSASQPEVHVKILLQAVPLDHPIQLSFNSDQKLLVTFSTQPNRKYVTRGPILLNIKSDGDLLYVHSEGKRSYVAAPTIVITPESNHLELDSRRYAGSIILHVADKTLYIVNKLPLEQYVYGVLKTESWPGWPLEVNKALAIAIRTYALHMIAKLEHKSPLYHMRNTTAHQTYNGHHETPVHQQAVEQTAHMFVAHNNEPIIAMYDACCGGIIPAHIKGAFDVSKAPYLKRTKRCTYCEGSRSYRWLSEFTPQELELCLKKALPKLSGLRDIRVIQQDKAGVVQRIRIRDRRRNYEITGKKLYEVCDRKVRSFAFTITKQDGTFVVEGKGIGHHLGICQWGARAMVDYGMSYKDIIHFYYPDTDIRIIKAKATQLPQEVHQLTEITNTVPQFSPKSAGPAINHTPQSC